MNWSTFIIPLLKAKQSILVILGQIVIYFFVFTSGESHLDKMSELMIASAIFWIGYAYLAYNQRTAHDHDVKELEMDFDKMTKALEVDHKSIVDGLEAQIHILQIKLDTQAK